MIGQPHRNAERGAHFQRSWLCWIATGAAAIACWIGAAASADDFPVTRADLIEVLDSDPFSDDSGTVAPNAQSQTRKKSQQQKPAPKRQPVTIKPPVSDDSRISSDDVVEALPPIRIGPTRSSTSLMDILQDPNRPRVPARGVALPQKSTKGNSLESILNNSKPQTPAGKPPRLQDLLGLDAEIATSGNSKGDIEIEAVPLPPTRRPIGKQRVAVKLPTLDADGDAAPSRVQVGPTPKHGKPPQGSATRDRTPTIAQAEQDSADKPSPVPVPRRSRVRVKLTNAELSLIDPAIKPIGQITASSLPPRGLLPENVAARERANQPVVWQSDDRQFAACPFFWEATQYEHQPLYFEQINLERHGYDRGCLQPFFSAGNFYGGVAMLPYKVVCYPWYCSYSTLGHYRPGSCAPYRCHTLPWRWDAAAAEVGAWTGFGFLFP